MSIPGSAFPPEFDAGMYRSLNPGLEHRSDAEAREHYEETGGPGGLRAHPLANRASLLAIVAQADSVLELYPEDPPLLAGPAVSYFDVKAPGRKPRRAGDSDTLEKTVRRPVTHVSAYRDLSVVDRTFDVVVSSHSLEHVPDLAGHLQQVERLLNPGGWYVAMIPDKRYCLDHFTPETTIGDVLEAAIERRSLHSARTLVNQQALRTHNEAQRHWAGDHGRPEGLDAGSIEAALEQFVESVSHGEFIDRHGWQFTDQSFRETVRLLNDLRLISLPAFRVYPAEHGSNEFWAVLGPKPELGGADAPAASSGNRSLGAAATGEGWGVDSVQPQPNLIVIRGWSDTPPTGVMLETPQAPPIAGMIEACVRSEKWGPADSKRRESGFIAVFPLRQELQVEQFVASVVHVEFGGRRESIRIRAIGEDRKAAFRAQNSLLKRWQDSVDASSRVLEVGARRRTADSIRNLLPGQFLGVDIVNGSGVDVIADAHLLADALGGQRFTHAFSTSVFEHLFCPIQAASEINAVLEDGALIFVHSHQTWGYHEAPWDFFRFSDSAWRALFNEVTGFEVIETAMSDEAVLVPATEWGNPALYGQAHAAPGYHTSVVLARKTGPSRLKRLFTAEELKRVYPGFYPD